jgi:hypothetical protein
MLKTQTKEENKFMIRILPHYYQYLTENPHSLLVRILGKCLFLRDYCCHPEQSINFKSCLTMYLVHIQACTVSRCTTCGAKYTLW